MPDIKPKDKQLDLSNARSRPCDTDHIFPYFAQKSSRLIAARNHGRDKDRFSRKFLQKDLKEIHLHLAPTKPPASNLGISHRARYHSLSLRQNKTQKKQSSQLQNDNLKLPQLLHKTQRQIHDSLMPQQSQSSDRLPLSPSLAKIKYAKILTLYQHQQVMQFEQIWYIGLLEVKGTLQTYTDIGGNYVVKPHDHIYYRYQIHKAIGRGTFGQVYKALDHKTKQFVAIKINKNKPKYAQQAQSQIKMHQLACGQEAFVVNLRSHFQFRGHYCLVFDLLHCTLYHIIRYNTFSLQLIRKIAKQILTTLNYFGKKKIIHCDLKPQNIMLKSKGNSHFRVIDLGSACLQDDATRQYVQSRFYRAPQVILGMAPYTLAIDMWSLATILVQLAIGHPLFPGENQTDQILNIGQLLGAPPIQLIKNTQRGAWYFQKGEFAIIDKKGQIRKVGSKSLEQIIQIQGKGIGQFIDFVKKGLRWHPKYRMSAQEGLIHPWITGNYD